MSIKYATNKTARQYFRSLLLVLMDREVLERPYGAHFVAWPKMMQKVILPTFKGCGIFGDGSPKIRTWHQ